jgi:hypothetical protein
MTDIHHTSHEQHKVGTCKTGCTETFSKQTADQRNFSTNQGPGVHTEVQQNNARMVETEITKTNMPVGKQPMVYTEEARKLDAAGKLLDQNIKQIDDKTDRDDKFAKEHANQIDKLESEAEKAAKSFNKEQQKHLKEQTKDQEKLRKQEEKTMEMAAKLSAKQQEQQKIEAEKAAIAMQKDAEARRLANELIQKRDADRAFAERKMHELATAEEQFKQKARELAAHQAQEIQQLEIKQKEMNVNVEVARKNVEELKRKHEADLKSLDNNKADLERLRAEAKQAGELAQQHLAERAQLEQQIRDLDNKALREQERARQLVGEHEHLQNEIAGQKQQIIQDQAALKDREQIAIKQQEQKRTVETISQENIKNEELALRKAQALSGKTEKERQEAQKEVARLTAELQDAKKQASEMTKTCNVKVEQKPATIDVYQHKRYETTEPVVTEVTSEHHTKEDRSLGEKIVDGVKNLF